MIPYVLLRAIAGIALRWYYRGIEVAGLERLPRTRPMVLVVNHPNALVDALLVGWVVPRRIRTTAKSTLFTNPIAGRLLRWIGVVPLHRTKDVADLGVRSDPLRNREAFRAVGEVLRKRGTVLIFPEGISHDEPALAPLRSGAARMALAAAESGVDDLAIIPIGLTFERKEAPRTRVFVQIGEPIILSEWRAADASSASQELTAEIETRLRAVTLNFASSHDAARSLHLASMLAALFDDVKHLTQAPRGFGAEAALARRIDEWTRRLQSSDQTLYVQADALVRRLEALQHQVARRRLFMEDLGIDPGYGSALRFVLREGWLLLLAGPIALWGRINHWLPFTAARALGKRSVESAADPAMRTMLAGTALVLLAYLAQTAAIAAIWNPWIALGYVVSLPIAADIDFYLSEHTRRAIGRARAWLRFRREPALQQRLSTELTTLRRDVVDFEHALGASGAAAAK